jgi:membrane protein DedA with SNARE-associated domain/rhodanese-related sulfurtransferase
VEILAAVAQHGYLLVAGLLFLFCVGAPLPASVVLLAAGTAAAHNFLQPEAALGCAIAAGVLGDAVMYFGGRSTGFWLLAILCKLSLNPESCIFRSARYFYKRGSMVLIVAKFLPGLGAMAAPLAGSLNMRWWKFLRLDAMGVTLYCTWWFSLGFFFSPFFTLIAGLLHTAAHVIVVVVLIGLVGYVATVAVFSWRARRFLRVEGVTASDVVERLAENDPERVVVIADVRSHGYYEKDMQRIKNSIRIEPHKLADEMGMLQELVTPECEVYVYCTCAREATSRRVAHMLCEQGYKARVIVGGLRSWKRQGFPMEAVPAADIEHLPAFD